MRLRQFSVLVVALDLLLWRLTMMLRNDFDIRVGSRSVSGRFDLPRLAVWLRDRQPVGETYGHGRHRVIQGLWRERQRLLLGWL
jgi:hypothetical protein